MSRYASLLLIALAMTQAAECASSQGRPLTPRTAALLAAGREPVRIVCLGDSIAGVYYHTGSRRAYCDMLGIALKRIYPQAIPRMINAGVSGDTTVGGLQRLEHDVLRYQPHLVTIMFGMNDVMGVPPEQDRGNLVQMIQQCREVGAEVILCTPNSIYPEDQYRTVGKLQQYAQIVREVGRAEKLPVADCYRTYERIRARDRRAWMLLMSDVIHPNMSGHKVIAQEIARVISGQQVSVADVPPPLPSIPRTLRRLADNEPLKIIAMPPYDELITPALCRLNPAAQTQVTSWPVCGESLPDIEARAKGIRDQHPDLVVIAVPAEATAESEEQFIRSYSWVLSWSLDSGPGTWDCIAILPSVGKPDLSPEQRAADCLAREIVRGQDIGIIERGRGDRGTAAEILSRWLQTQGAG